MQLQKILTATALGLLMLAVGAPSGFCDNTPKLGTVNFQKIFENSTGGQAVKNQLNAEGQRLEQDLQKRADEIKAIEERLARDTGVMSQQAREEQRWELERKANDLNSLKRNYERRMQEMQARLINEVRQAVLQVVHGYAQQEGYALIVEDIGVVYAAAHLDITEEILKGYNEIYAKRGNQRQGARD